MYADYHPVQVWSLGAGMGKSATHLLTKGASSAKLGATKEAANPNPSPNPDPDPYLHPPQVLAILSLLPTLVFTVYGLPELQPAKVRVEVVVGVVGVVGVGVRQLVRWQY